LRLSRSHAGSFAAAGTGAIGLFDANAASAEALAQRLHNHYPQLQIATGSKDPAGYDIVVNATPLGMNEGDPLPLDVSSIDARTFVGEVVMEEITPFIRAAKDRGCTVQIGTDMLFEQIPAYLEFFGFGLTRLCCTDRGAGAATPTPSESGDADVFRASQLQHAVEHLDGDLDLGGPALVRMRAQPVPDHPLPPPDSGLGPSSFHVP
jgi:hypothetical protein